MSRSSETAPVNGANPPVVRRIGIDFGRVIAEITWPNSDKKIPVRKYHLRPEVLGAIEGIAWLVKYLGAENVFIIRNARGPRGGKQRQRLAFEKTWIWFRRNNFFERTGMLRKNVLFPVTREDKQKVCQEHRITDLIDDRAEVAQHLDGVRWFAFRPTPDELKQFIHAVPAPTVEAMYKVNSWAELMPLLQAAFDPQSTAALATSKDAHKAWLRVQAVQEEAKKAAEEAREAGESTVPEVKL